MDEAGRTQSDDSRMEGLRNFVRGVMSPSSGGGSCLTFAEALQKVRDYGLISVESEKYLHLLEKEHAEQVARPAPFRDITTSAQEDLKEFGWYEGPGAHPGGLWEVLNRRFSESPLSKAVPQMDASSTEVVRRLAEPGRDGDHRVGVVIGNVQSGKTANYSAVIAKAVDAGYKLIIVLSGIHNNLRSQTQARLERDLGVGTGTDWHALTDIHSDFGRTERRNATTTLRNQSRIIAVVKKNSRRLTNLLEYLENVDPETMDRTPVLIIDDESDQATPDSSTDAAADPSTINKLLRQIWGKVSNGSYVGYTATPFANFFMDPTVDNGGGLPSLYPESFIHVMPTPGNYFGAERIFGISAEDPEDEAQAGRAGLDVVRPIPEVQLSQLRPLKRAEVDEFEAEVPKALADAINWFIVACAIRRARGQEEQHSSMLIHTTQYTEPHFSMKAAVKDYLKPLWERSVDGDVSVFREIFLAERDKVADLYQGDSGAVTWQELERQLPEVLRLVNVVVDNGRENPEERLDYSKRPQTTIVIGGGTLSRGLTLEGLFVSFFARSSNAYDTLLQMGRWFGYREGYEDLQRIWLSDGLEEDYRFLARVEQEMRDEVVRMIEAGQKPSDIGVRIRCHPGRLQITSANKMRHAAEVETDFEGYRLQTYIFDVSDDALMEKNRNASVTFLKSIAESVRGEKDRKVYEEIPFHKIRGFLSEFQIHPHFSSTHNQALEWAGKKLPDVNWNVVVAGGSRLGLALVDTPTPVKPVNRAPFAGGSVTGGNGALNIRTLMTGDDMVLDLKGLGRYVPDPGQKTTGLKEMRAARRDRTAGGGRGLLVLYPISRNSTVSRGSKESGARQSMTEALSALGSQLSRDPEEKHPIMGYSMILPYDINGELDRRGRFIAVTPNPIFGNEEEEIEFEDEDSDYEGDFHG